MSDEIKKLRNEVDDLKSSLRFWKRLVIAIAINIPLIAGTILILYGVGEMNAVHADFLSVRIGGFILSITNLVLLIGIDLYLLLG